MRRIILTLTAILMMAISANAQDKSLRKYMTREDVKTTTITKGMMSLLPLDKIASFGNGKDLSSIVGKMESLQVLQTDSKKISKQWVKKLPKKLGKENFSTLYNGEQAGKQVRIMQSIDDPSRVVAIIGDYYKSTVINAKGNFSASDLSF